MSESQEDFIARMKADLKLDGYIALPADCDRLIAGYEERVMVEKHRLCVGYMSDELWQVFTPNMKHSEAGEGLSTAIRQVVAKIEEGK